MSLDSPHLYELTQTRDLTPRIFGLDKPTFVFPGARSKHGQTLPHGTDSVFEYQLRESDERV